MFNVDTMAESAFNCAPVFCDPIPPGYDVGGVYNNSRWLYVEYLADLFGFALELDLLVSKPGDGDGFDATELFGGACDAWECAAPALA